MELLDGDLPLRSGETLPLGVTRRAPKDRLSVEIFAGPVELPVLDRSEELVKRRGCGIGNGAGGRRARRHVSGGVVLGPTTDEKRDQNRRGATKGRGVLLETRFHGPMIIR